MNEEKIYPPMDLEKFTPKMNVTVIRENSQLPMIADFFSRKKEFGYDLETNVVKDLNERYIRTIQVGDRDEQYVIDLLPFAQCATSYINLSSVDILKLGQRDSSIRDTAFGEITKTLRPALDSREWLKVGHNLQFEYEMTKLSLGIRSWNFWDTMLAEKIILCGLVAANAEGYFAMYDVMRKYGHVTIDKSLQKSFDDLGAELTEQQIIYAALDTRLPFTIRAHQTKTLIKDNLMRTAQIEFDAVPAFGDMRVNGFYCSPEKWLAKFQDNVKTLSGIIDKMDVLFSPIVGLAKEPEYDLVLLEKEWRDQPDKLARAEARKAFQAARGEISSYRKRAEKFQGSAAINYNSNDEVREALLKMKGIPAAKLKDTNDKTLDKLATKGKEGQPGYVKGHPAIDLLRDYREYSKAIKNYGEEFLRKYVSKISGRLHSSINQIGAMTGRTSSENPNTQNIPKDEAYRHCFISRPGYKIITTDIAGCELRIVASMSGEIVWIEAFKNDQDVHSLGAEFVYPTEWLAAAGPDCAFYMDGKRLKCNCKAHSKIRGPIKNLNFGVIYGLSVFGYMRDTGKKKQDAEQDLSRYRMWVPTLWKFLEELSASASFNLESRTTIGRRRIFKRPTWETAKVHFMNDPRNHKRVPTQEEIKHEMKRMWASIDREGRNAPIQGGNGDLIKLAMGCGFDSSGKPFLWHRLEPEYGGLLENLVHDELVTEGPDEHAEEIQEATQDAILRAGKEIYKDVLMKSETNIAPYWSK